MSSSRVYLTPCWAGKNPLIRVERAGEHMQALVNAFSKSSPLRFSCVRPGRFSAAQPFGKCWIARSWSVRKTTTFIPARPPRLPADAASARSTWAPAPCPISSAGAATAADSSSSLRVSPLPCLRDPSIGIPFVSVRPAGGEPNTPKGGSAGDDLDLVSPTDSSSGDLVAERDHAAVEGVGSDQLHGAAGQAPVEQRLAAAEDDGHDGDAHL